MKTKISSFVFGTVCMLCAAILQPLAILAADNPTTPLPATVPAAPAPGGIPLRPSPTAGSPGAPGQTDLQDNNGVGANTGNVTAKQAIDADFAKHTYAAAAVSKGAPSTKSGASGDKSVPVLRNNDQQSDVGPSKSTSDSTVPDDIKLSRPALQSLVSVNNYLNPFSLDATNTNALNLRRALVLGLDQNLDLAISRANTKQRQFAYYSSLGNFLPDPVAGYSEYFVSGRVGLPSGIGSLFASSLAGTTGTSAALATSSATSSGDLTVRLHRPIEIMHGGVEFYAYRGGSVLFGAQQSKHNYKAAKFQEKASLSDTLMTITQNYYNLVLAEALLQIRIEAVRTSEEQLRRNLDRFHSGLATNLDVLQSRTQLSRDRQALVDQQANRRSAAITLATSLYVNLGEDLIATDLLVRKIRLVDPSLNIADILQLAIDHRPELSQYEELRLAAKKAIMVAGANLQPSVLLAANGYGIGPPSNVQGLGVFAVNINWRLRGLGTVDAFDVQQARWQARSTRLQAQNELQTVLSQVRNSYVQILDKEKNIDEASSEVESAAEELRLAELRKSSGLGINLDIITAQRDYTQAKVDKAQALINFDIAQAQLVHDMGLISIDALTSGKVLSKERAK